MMRCMPWGLSLLAILSSLVFSLPLHAEVPTAEPSSDAAARSAFETGRDAYERGDFPEALRHFERAHELSKRTELFFNIGRAADADGQTARAISAYTAYLEALPNADNREFVRARLVRLRALDPRAPAAPPEAASSVETEQVSPPSQASVGEVVIETRPAASALRIDGLPLANTDEPHRLSAGPHLIEAEAVGYLPEKRQLQVRGGERQLLTVLFSRTEHATEHAVTRPWVRSPWRWSAVGAVVVGAVTATALAVRRGDEQRQTFDDGTWDVLGKGP
jgi:tetratricopeptide (TPR) repeat protein